MGFCAELFRDDGICQIGGCGAAVQVVLGSSCSPCARSATLRLCGDCLDTIREAQAAGTHVCADCQAPIAVSEPIRVRVPA